MRVVCCGVRGSTPAPGAEFVRVGGHTSCLAIAPEGSAVPRLVLDAGTGIRRVTGLLAGAAFSGTVLLTHLHWDHVQGLPFFTAGDHPDAQVRLVVPNQGEPAVDTLARSMSPPQFPIGPEGLRGAWRFDAIEPGEHELEGLRVLAREIPHKGGRTFGYRVSDATGSLAYLPDHLPARSGPERDAAIELAAGVDVLMHGGQFVTSETAIATDFGHATVDAAIALAVEAGAARLVLTHHHPNRSDDQVDAIVAACAGAPLPVSAASEGDVLWPGIEPGSSVMERSG